MLLRQFGDYPHPLVYGNFHLKVPYWDPRKNSVQSPMVLADPCLPFPNMCLVTL